MGFLDKVKLKQNYEIVIRKEFSGLLQFPMAHLQMLLKILLQIANIYALQWKKIFHISLLVIIAENLYMQGSPMKKAKIRHMQDLLFSILEIQILSQYVVLITNGIFRKNNYCWVLTNLCPITFCF